MPTRAVASLALFLGLAVPALAVLSTPRASPEFTIVEPSGRTTLLSSLKGRVVVMEFLLVRCAGCLRVAQTMDKLNGEMGGGGLQPIGIAFDNGIGGPAVRSFVQLLNIRYPVGYATSDAVDRYLGRATIERIQVPQLVVIDRAGIIRAQSRPTGEANLIDEDYLRHLIRALLDESATTGKTEAPAAPSATE